MSYKPIKGEDKSSLTQQHANVLAEIKPYLDPDTGLLRLSNLLPPFDQYREHPLVSVNSENKKTTRRNERRPRSSNARLMDLYDAAEYLGVSVSLFRQWIYCGEIPFVQLPCPGKDGRSIRRKLVDKRDLDDFTEKHKERNE